MGAWGSGTFQNDSALDVLDSMILTGDFGEVVKTIYSTASPQHFDIDIDALSDRALASVTLLAGALGLHPPDLPGDAQIWINTNKPQVTLEDVAHATRALANLGAFFSQQKGYWDAIEVAADSATQEDRYFEHKIDVVEKLKGLLSPSE